MKSCLTSTVYPIPEECSQQTSKLKKLLSEFVSNEFGSHEKFFAFIYGSYAYNQAKNDSDFDFVIVSSNTSPGRTQRAIEFANDVHKSFGMSLDNEIRYEDKLIISCEFLELACKGHGFKNHLGEWYIPEIVKTEKCLSSLNLRLRFFHALMTHYHIFLGGDRHYYENLRVESAKNLLKAICTVKGIDKINPQVLNRAFMEHNGTTGDFYLGFREGDVPNLYANELCENLLRILHTEGEIEFDGKHYNISNFLNNDP